MEKKKDAKDEMEQKILTELFPLKRSGRLVFGRLMLTYQQCNGCHISLSRQ
jgi:hypothetical protein